MSRRIKERNITAGLWKGPSGKNRAGRKSGELYVLYRDYAMSIATGEPLAQMNYDRLRQSAEVISAGTATLKRVSEAVYRVRQSGIWEYFATKCWIL